MGVDLGCSFPASGTHSSNLDDKMQLHCNTFVDGNATLALKVPPLSNQEVGVSGSVYEEKVSDGRGGVSGSVGDDKTPDGMRRDGDHYSKHEGEVKEDEEYMITEAVLPTYPTSTGVKCSQSNQRKRAHIDLLDTAPPTLTFASQEMSWNGVNNNMLIDGESIGKKLKTGLSDMYGCSSYSGRNTLGDSIPTQGKDLPCSLVEEKRCVEACDEKVIPEDLGTTERFFFPVDSRHAKGDNHASRRGLSTGNEDRLHDGFPNLELALGAETKPQNRGIRPFFVGLVDKKNNQDKAPEKVMDDDKEDDVSASLSLSLSFPFPDKEQPVKPVSKSEQLRPERRHVNTSLLLFGGFPEK